MTSLSASPRVARLAAPLLLLALPALAAAQTPAAPAPADAPRVVVGRVVDSLVTGRPLAGAEIWLDGSPAGVTTDSLGSYRLEGAQAGWRALGFVHPALDSVGVAAPIVHVELPAAGETRVNLATPSAATFHLRACGQPPGDGEGVLVGVVQDAESDEPVGGATVTTAWLEFTLAREGLQRVQRSARVNSDVDGRFTMCAVPADVAVEASASAGARSSGPVDVELGVRGFAVRHLRVGRPGAAVVTGTVRDTLGRAVPHARVNVAGTEVATSADSAGTFRLAGVPSGSQTVEVRAVGYAPARVPVVARAAAPTQIRVTVGRTQLLPTVAIVGRPRARVDLTGFDERRKRGNGGYFMTQDEIAKRQAFRSSDVLRTMPGIRVMHTQAGTQQLLLPRGGLGTGCVPTLYLDGVVVYQGASMFDEFVRPNELFAVEVYPSVASVPVEYRMPNSTCGVVLLWTRRR